MSIHLAREKLASADLTNKVPENSKKMCRKVQITSKPQIVEFDPTLPAAAFPSLSQPWARSRKVLPTRAKGDPSALAAHRSNNNCGSKFIDNGNMSIIGSIDEKEVDGKDSLCISDSDDDPIDDQERLRRKITNPTWSNLKPAMQLQITAALLKKHNWNTICNGLGLNKEERTKLKHYFVTRNKQILREDRILRKMREKQLAHLMDMDQSILKKNAVPLQLVLSKISRDAHALILDMAEPELEFCRVDDILAARQFLRKRRLDEGLAGEWGSPLVELISNNHAEEDILPEKFQWKDNWTLPENTFINPHGPIRDCAPGRSFAALPPFVKSMCSNRGPYNTINPRETFRDDIDPHPFKDWKEHIPFYLRDEFQAMSKKIRERIRRQMSRTKDISEQTRVRVGPRGEARLSPTFRDQSLDRWMKREQEKESQRALLRRPHVPLPLFDDGTPSKLPKGTPSHPGTNDTQPVTRSLGGCWSLNDVHPSVSQSRYERQIEDARLESAQERQMRVTQSVDTGTASTRDFPKCFTNLSDEKRKMNFQTRVPSKPVTDLPGHREPLRSRSHVQSPESRIMSISEDDQKVLDDFFFKYIVPGSYTK